MTNKINIRRAKRRPTIDWVRCGEEWGYNIFAKEKPKAIALRLISEVFGDGDLSNLKFVYYPKRYRGLQSLQDVLSVFYKNNI